MLVLPILALAALLTSWFSPGNGSWMYLLSPVLVRAFTYII